MTVQQTVLKISNLKTIITSTQKKWLKVLKWVLFVWRKWVLFVIWDLSTVCSQIEYCLFWSGNKQYSQKITKGTHMSTLCLQKMSTVCYLRFEYCLLSIWVLFIPASLSILPKQMVIASTLYQTLGPVSPSDPAPITSTLTWVKVCQDFYPKPCLG